MRRVTSAADEWDAVWRDYDARRPAVPTTVEEPRVVRPRRLGSKRRFNRLTQSMAVGADQTLPSAWNAPVVRARPLLRRSRPGFLAAAALVCLAGLIAAMVLPPMWLARDVVEAMRAGDPLRIAQQVDWSGLRTDTGEDGAMAEQPADAGVFLRRLAGEVAASQTTPAGLLALLQARRHDGEPVLRPAGLGTARLVFPGVTLRLAAQSPLRWRVVGLEIGG